MRFWFVVPFLIAGLVSSSLAQTFSSGGDTASFGNTGMAKSLGIESSEDPAALLGSASEGTITTTWGQRFSLRTSGG